MEKNVDIDSLIKEDYDCLDKNDLFELYKLSRKHLEFERIAHTETKVKLEKLEDIPKNYVDSKTIIGKGKQNEDKI